MDDVISFPRSPKDRRPRCPTDEIDRVRAAKLRKFSRQQGWTTAASPRRWAESFALLRRSLGDAHLRIDAVLDWYVGWYADGKRPTVRDGGEFRARFDWLSQLYAKEQLIQPPAQLPTEVVFVLDAVRAVAWPPRADAQLPGVVGQSFENLRSHYRACRQAGDAATLAVVGSSYEGYLVQWFLAVWRRYHSWAGWDQDLGRHVWSPSHADFLKAVAAANLG